MPSTYKQAKNVSSNTINSSTMLANLSKYQVLSINSLQMWIIVKLLHTYYSMKNEYQLKMSFTITSGRVMEISITNSLRKQHSVYTCKEF